MRNPRLIGAIITLGIVLLLAFSSRADTAIARFRPIPDHPSRAVFLDIDALRIADRISALTLDERIAQLMMVHCAGLDAAAVAACAAASGVSGVILMGDNIGATPEEVAALTAALPNDPFFATLVAIDEEGGEVTRLPWDTLPGGGELADASVADVQAVFTERAGMLHRIGVNLNFGIVADVTDDPQSFLSDRVLGHDPASAAEHVTAAMDGEHGHVASTLKHFPGHGAASGNSHSELPVADLSAADWAATAALPFSAGIAAGANAVMMAHIVLPAVDAVPASLSPVWHQVLRDQLGFHGVIVSDDLLMLQANGLPEFADPAQNAIRALQAGTDLLLWVVPADPATAGIDFPAIRAAIADAVQSGKLPPQTITDALDRIYRLRLQLGRAD